VPKNDVINTSPAPGAQEPSNANVNLTVSSGPSTIIVPYVIGDTQSQAASMLTTAGLSPVVICQLTLDPSQDGLVQAQTPNGGQNESPGTTVNITVGSLSGCSGSTTTTAPAGNSGGGGGGGGHNF
jgi:eukaryotic-like serine/threonine-protein kinase